MENNIKEQINETKATEEVAKKSLPWWIFAAIGGAIILKERMAPRAYLGCVLILAGIVLSQLKFKEKTI